MDYTTLGITPVSAETPAGTDVKYDETFEKIEAEIAKLSSPTESGTLDWELVVTLSEEILEKRSKNLLVAVYLTYALFRQRGIPGLMDGVRVIADLLEHYWETLYPPLRRMKGRMNAIEWLLDKVSTALEKSEPVEVDAAQKEAFMSDLRRIDELLNDKVEDAPLFYNLIQLADMRLILPEETAPEPATEEQPQAEEEPTAAETTEAEPTPPQPEPQQQTTDPAEGEEAQVETQHTPEHDSDLQQRFDTLLNELNIVTGQMIEAADYRSELFMINRALAWLEIEEPPASEQGVTMLPPPDTQESALLKKLHDEKSYAALLWAAESRITTYLFWLDLHYYVADALRALGFTQASDVVLQQTRYFVEKLPGLQRLTFSDKTPFADERTKSWLRSAAETETHTNTATVQEEVPCDAAGIDRLSYLISHSESVEQEVLYNIALCHCLAATADPILITTYTRSLLRRIDTYKTQQWNPQVALDAYTAALACYQSLETPPDAELKTLYEKIALLKPSLLKEI